MDINITKSARQFGNFIWYAKMECVFRKLLSDRVSVDMTFNGSHIGTKNVDWKYHRLSIGYKFTRGIPERHNTYRLILNGENLEVTTINGNNK